MLCSLASFGLILHAFKNGSLILAVVVGCLALPSHGKGSQFNDGTDPTSLAHLSPEEPEKLNSTQICPSDANFSSAEGGFGLLDMENPIFGPGFGRILVWKWRTSAQIGSAVLQLTLVTAGLGRPFSAFTTSAWMPVPGRFPTPFSLFKKFLLLLRVSET